MAKEYQNELIYYREESFPKYKKIPEQSPSPQKRFKPPKTDSVIRKRISRL